MKLLNFVIISIMVFVQPFCQAFSRSSIFLAPKRINKFQQWSVATATATTIESLIPKNSENDFYPLGPPSFLANFPVGETYLLPSINKNVTRLSISPDMFFIRDFIPENERETLMQAAFHQGMKIAGTRQSDVNTVRKNSHLAWIDPYCLNFDTVQQEAASIARKTIKCSRVGFSHEIMNNVMNNTDRIDYAFAEDMQVAKYDAGGRYDYHHDGFARYLTVLTYLNGVGGTYFPFGDIGSALDGIDFTSETEASAMVMGLKTRVGKSGILVVGKEGSDSYLDYNSINPKTMIKIQPGDAIAFYNYHPDGEKDLRSLHCSLTVPEEKWISTCWFRSDALTGPFSSYKKVRLLEEWLGCQ